MGGGQLGDYYSDFGKAMNKIIGKIYKSNALIVNEIPILNGHFFVVFKRMVIVVEIYNVVKYVFACIKNNMI